jgi:drug/metabolite transporter (DMT)-like permease
VAAGYACLALAVLGWGLVWPANKAILDSLSPAWFAALRSVVALIAILAITVPARRLVLPPRGDWPVVVGIAVLHMTGFALLAAVGLQLVSVGRSVVLAYTTPLWVLPAAALFLGERLTLRKWAGAALGLGGILVLFNPFAFDWRDARSVGGHAALLGAALLWAASIVQIRRHRWTATPFQLVPWEIFLSTGLLLAIALLSGEPPQVDWTPNLVWLLIGTGALGIIPYWAVATAGVRLPALTVSLGLLGAPIVGVLAAAVALGEPMEAATWAALTCVIGGVLLASI